jgi:hypothetical protein
MAERQRKFGALANLREPTDDDKSPAPATGAPAPGTERRKGRAPGKRSNPEWKLYSHFLKKQTQRKATAILRAQEDESRDLSDVLQQLLESWIEEQKPNA